jgi:polar amino acid transport system substrate-binding protein
MTRWIVLLTGLLLATAAQAGETLDRVRRDGVLVNALVNDYPPFSSLSDTNELVGFDVDVARAVASRLGVKLRLETPGWETIVAGSWRGRIDISIGSMTPSAERAKVLDFPVIYYDSPAVLVVHKDETRIKGATDLTGKRVGVGTGSTYEQYVNKTLSIEGGRPISFPFGAAQAVPQDESVAFQNLALGPGVRLDAIVANLSTTQDRIRAGRPFRIVGLPLYAEPSAVAIDRGDPEFGKLIRDTMLGLRADGTLAAISRKWLGEDVTADVR